MSTGVPADFLFIRRKEEEEEENPYLTIKQYVQQFSAVLNVPHLTLRRNVHY